MGKSFCNYRLIEEAVATGKKVLILDYTKSYTFEERAKANFLYEDKTIEFNPVAHPFFWISNYKDKQLFERDLCDALISALNISSYFQKKWLIRAVSMHLQKNGCLNFSKFLKTLEEMYYFSVEAGESQEDLNNLKRLLSKFEPYGKINGIFLKNSEDKNLMSRNVYIIRLSGYSELERKFLSNLFVSLLWKEVQHGESRKFDVCVLDEVQNVSLKEGNALSSFLREGRKHEMRLILSTQFISDYSKGEISSLLQAGNVLIFNPDETDLKFSAQIIDCQNYKQWQKLLSNLNVGSVVLKGHYQINEKNTICVRPIICKI